MADYISNKATARRVGYLDIDGKEGFTQQKFDTIKDFYSWCEYWTVLSHLKLDDGKA